jgi:hypothetical protein
MKNDCFARAHRIADEPGSPGSQGLSWQHQRSDWVLPAIAYSFTVVFLKNIECGSFAMVTEHIFDNRYRQTI